MRAGERSTACRRGKLQGVRGSVLRTKNHFVLGMENQSKGPSKDAGTGTPPTKRIPFPGRRLSTPLARRIERPPFFPRGHRRLPCGVGLARERSRRGPASLGGGGVPQGIPKQIIAKSQFAILPSPLSLVPSRHDYNSGSSGE